MIGDSANCCTGSHNTPETCPPSGVQYYDFFSALFYSSPAPDVFIQRPIHPLQRKTALTPMSMLMMRAARLRCGPASRSTTATIPSFSAPKLNRVEQKPIPKFSFSCSSPLCRGDAVVHYNTAVFEVVAWGWFRIDVNVAEGPGPYASPWQVQVWLALYNTNPSFSALPFPLYLPPFFERVWRYTGVVPQV